MQTGLTFHGLAGAHDGGVIFLEPFGSLFRQRRRNVRLLLSLPAVTVAIGGC